MSSTREIRTARRSGSPLSAPARLSLAVALALSGLSAGVQAQSLVDLYQAAKNYDAAYLSAKAQADSAQYKAAQAYAQRMPLVNLKGTLTRQHFDSADNDAARAAASQAGLSSTNYS
ncbi:MAG TPA: hypothetical protein VFH49_09490, partial [Aquabacterium sp.]|nr:hypothetical protein [Aquabacterium sp.]